MQATSSLNQGMQFAKLTSTYHGGSRKMRRNSRTSRKMRKTRRSSKRQSGGSFLTPYSEYSTAFDSFLPKDLSEAARVSSLDAKFAELPAVERAAGVPMAGGSRRTRRHRGGVAPVDAPSMILQTPAEETAARLNPQWYTENTVNPNFRGELPVPGGPAKGGRRQSSRSRRSRSSRYKMMRS